MPMRLVHTAQMSPQTRPLRYSSVWGGSGPEYTPWGPYVRQWCCTESNKYTGGLTRIQWRHERCYAKKVRGKTVNGSNQAWQRELHAQHGAQ